MKHFFLILIVWLVPSVMEAVNPVDRLIERLEKGASRHFLIEKVVSEQDFFELSSRKGKVVIRGNSYVNISVGVHHYIKQYLHQQISWSNFHIHMPDTLPLPVGVERHETNLPLRYDLNYCTHSYSMAFWDWTRWEQEIDWMALHGINLPLAITGTECVWFNVLKRLGYTRQEIDAFIAGPAFMAWWLMNNLEGWGGPNPDSWYARQEALQKKIVGRMRELDMHPVFAGYAGMVPNNAREKLHLDVANPGRWCGYRRPAFLQPTDPLFAQIAELYYKELTRLYGKAEYYSMDPFHEGGQVDGVDLQASGQAILEAMRRCNPRAVWVAQAWQSCPHEAMIESLPPGSLLVLDLFAETLPQWGDPSSAWCRKKGFLGHDWAYCMLLNYGGNVGLHGKMQHLVDSYFEARHSAFGQSMRGIGLTMEGIENNPVMYELMTELPWRKEPFKVDEWLKSYITSRYGAFHSELYQAWLRLAHSIYACPDRSEQAGTHESIFCARPSDQAYQVSSWSGMQDYYNPWDVIESANQFASVQSAYKGCANYAYDLVDLTRQAIAERGRMVYRVMNSALVAREKALFTQASERFMELLMQQDSLLASCPEFRLDTWLTRAAAIGQSPEEKAHYLYNAKVQITTWGHREAAEEGGLRDYAHKEWNGLLSQFYALRWRTYIGHKLRYWDAPSEPAIDWYTIEEKWINDLTPMLLRSDTVER